jgi:hypothetical protein
LALFLALSGLEVEVEVEREEVLAGLEGAGMGGYWS